MVDRKADSSTVGDAGGPPEQLSFDDGRLGWAPDDIAGMLGCTTRTLRDYASRGIIPKPVGGRYALRETVSGYCEYMRGQASGRAGDALSKNRAELAQEQTLAAKRKNALEAGELALVADLEAAVADEYREVRTRLLAIPGNVAGSLTDEPDASVIQDRLQREIGEALEELTRDNGSEGPSERPSNGARADHGHAASDFGETVERPAPIA